MPYCQLDTVVGAQLDTKIILTICFPSLHFQFGVLIDVLTSDRVVEALLDIRKRIEPNTYKLLFGTILTDNGFEF